ncbi:hypothetical protein [Pseudorhodoferax sp. Leaf265]|jgi:hypothetical protein|uniref:hypothetical protein n=1 Tax=Pseudorhodoferax sp. Leaf265 TaxID=1736315 RepID=UPI0006FE1080|nr:hypothetical protein [Pseudorhodoferax sp. Leaf265]KQP19191.1 hypothetical protein ASF45_25820 [Pseudorhodoferax sp. Leaf265]PZP98496.1 MAG: hypothetical protein DI583_14185 [Variovorax paradoxus]PZQ09898.1 MAG: hypothetical protein DI587_14185 [Variovorax paradoxus]
MATPRNLKRLQNLVWILIYGGLLTLVFGLAVGRGEEKVLGHSLVVGGAIVAAIGVVLIFVRARLKPSP